jgi:glutaryl-CoA dehydrogenase
MLSKAFSSLIKPSSSVAVFRTSRACFATGTKLAKFDFEDPLQIEDLFTEEEKMVRDSARQFAQEKLLPRVRKAYNDEHFDREIMREYGA